MVGMEERIACVGCGALVPNVDGPIHRYIGASAGCWAIYGEVLSREYSDFRYARVHPLTVDAYAIQHPGTPSPQSIQSVAVHLISLHKIFDDGLDLQEASRVRQRATAHKGLFEWLQPPATLGALTILDVHAAGDPDEHAARVHQWARSAWTAWAEHHNTIRRWAARAVDSK